MRPGHEGRGRTSPTDGAEPEAWTTEGGSKSLRKLGLQAEAAAGAGAPGQGCAGVGSAGGDPQATGRAATPGCVPVSVPCDRGRSMSAGTGVPCAGLDPIVAKLLPHIPHRVRSCFRGAISGSASGRFARGAQWSVIQDRDGSRRWRGPSRDGSTTWQAAGRGCSRDGCDLQGSPVQPPVPHLGVSLGSPSSPSLLCPSMSHAAQEGVSTVVTETPGPQQGGRAQGSPGGRGQGEGSRRGSGVRLGLSVPLLPQP